jgi:putative ABC transport system permease protein
MLRLALKMLFGDLTKYLMLVAGLTFATLLMTQQIAIFCGLMRWTTGTLKNVPAPLWVVENKVEQVNETNPLLDTDVARVRSVDSVEWAAPLYAGILRARLANGNFKIVQLIGIDANTLAGAPVKLLQGRLSDLRLPHAVIIDEMASKKLSPAADKQPLKLGDTFEINDQEARIVGIAEAEQNFTGGNYIWTTYERALQFAPAQRKMLSAVIASPRAGISDEQCADDIERETGLKTYLNRGFQLQGGEKDFNTSTVWWYVKNTGIPFSFGTTIVIGFIVGMAISCQTFYSFILENMKHLGALKAMGTSTSKLCLMLLTQAFTAGFIGYGIGLLGCAAFGYQTLTSKQGPFYMPEIVPWIVLAIILTICMLASLLGIWRVAKLEPAMVFRG